MLWPHIQNHTAQVSIPAAPRTSHLTSQCLSFLICKMGKELHLPVGLSGELSEHMGTECPGSAPWEPRSLKTFIAWNLGAHLGNRAGLRGRQAHGCLAESTLGGVPQPLTQQTEWWDPAGQRVR